MKRVVYSPAALARLAEILDYTIGRFGDAQAEAYGQRLIARLEALAAGAAPHPRSCALLMQGVREAAGLVYAREGAHYLILRETDTTVELVDILHERMNLEAHLDRLIE